MSRVLFASALLAPLIIVFAAEPARGHTRFIFPVPRVAAALKVGPCGNVARGDNPLVVEAGTDLDVVWEEYIDHPGYYEIWFSPANDEDFELLLGDIPDLPRSPEGSNVYTATVSLPDVPCEAGTLQVIQYMTENPQSPSLYFSCADVRLVANDVGAFRRGDTNDDGTVDLSDAVRTFEYLFLGAEPPDCEEAADTNDDGTVDISDGVRTLAWLFTGGEPLPPPGPASCGDDPEAGTGPGCARYDGC